MLRAGTARPLQRRGAPGRPEDFAEVAVLRQTGRRSVRAQQSPEKMVTGLVGRQGQHSSMEVTMHQQGSSLPHCARVLKRHGRPLLGASHQIPEWHRGIALRIHELLRELQDREDPRPLPYQAAPDRVRLMDTVVHHQGQPLGTRQQLSLRRSSRGRRRANGRPPAFYGSALTSLAPPRPSHRLAYTAPWSHRQIRRHSPQSSHGQHSLLSRTWTRI